ncbi:MAG: DUF1559 domain-containing protein [Planctomycetaceae bacterium]
MPVRKGFTLVELLVVIGVISLLIGLLLPAVQNAREAARRTQCRNNLRQLALAATNHELVHGHLPTNGWGYRWVGDPDRGAGKRQPGGWAYNLLAFIEQENLREQGRGEPEPQKQLSLGYMTETPLAVFRCPTRPAPRLGLAGDASLNTPYNAAWLPLVAKTDYACCEGDFVTDTRGGPVGYDDVDTYTGWRDTSQVTGVCFQRSEVRYAQITDGLSNTYLLGEKYVGVQGYDTNEDTAYDQSLYSGIDWDLTRWVVDTPQRDNWFFSPRSFGSAHAGACQMALCDGSVRSISYSIDAEMHRRLGNRRDGQIINFH